MWNHLISLASPPVDLYLYTIYQAWSLFRQILRFSLVTRYAVSVSKELQKPLRQVMDLPSAHYEKESKRLQVIKVQCNKLSLLTLCYNFLSVIECHF